MVRRVASRLGVLAAGIFLVAVLTPISPAAARTQAAPSPRIGAAMAYDARDGRVVLFGGYGNYDSGFLDGTWTWDAGGWTHLTPTHVPAARRYAAMAYDAADGEVVLFGGSNFERGFGDTWTWNGADWTKRHPADAPSPRALAGLAYDSARGQVVLFGGASASGLRADTWTWDGNDWTKLLPAHAPSPRAGLTMADDSTHGQLVLFGGNDATLGDTWTWNGTDWSQQSPDDNPQARSLEAMADDPPEGGVLMYGGDNGGDDYGMGDTWAWDGTNWEPRNPAHRPAAREEAPAAYDAALGSVVLYGGLDGVNYLGDTWTWEGGDWAPQFAGSIRFARSGPPGSRISIDGWGFASRERVRIVFVDSILGDVHLGIATTEYDTTFYAAVDIPDDATPGVQYIKAKGMTSGQVAKQTYIVR